MALLRDPDDVRRVDPLLVRFALSSDDAPDDERRRRSWPVSLLVEPLLDEPLLELFDDADGAREARRRDGAREGERHVRLFRAAANLAEFDGPPALAHALLTEAALDSGLTPSAVRRTPRQ